MSITIETIKRYWSLLSGAAHLLISFIAALAVADIIHLSPTLLAILIAWANACTAIHRGADHFSV